MTCLARSTVREGKQHWISNIASFEGVRISLCGMRLELHIHVRDLAAHCFDMTRAFVSYVSAPSAFGGRPPGYLNKPRFT